jgi:hypothetical protein
VVVAGRVRSALEGVPLGDAELAEQVAWLQHGGPVPASARYAAGFIALLDPDGERTPEVWPFSTQRPIGVATHGGALWMLTEGTLEGGLQDGVLVRVNAAGDWSVEAQRLAMPEHLRFENGTPCWMEMPSGRFHFRCLSPAFGPTTLVDSDWNLLGATMTPTRVVWSVLTKGLHAAPVPGFGRNGSTN